MPLQISPHELADQIRMLQLDLDSKSTRLLESRGWEHYCGKPDFCWRWRKEIDGNFVLVDEATALGWELDSLEVEAEQK